MTNTNQKLKQKTNRISKTAKEIKQDFNKERKSSFHEMHFEADYVMRDFVDSGRVTDREYINKLVYDHAIIAERSILTRHDYAYMDMCIRWGLQSHAKRAKVGAILVQDGQIISDGYNGMPHGMPNVCENEDNQTNWEVLHAESNCLLKHSREGSGIATKCATMYCTYQPCPDCSKMIIQAGIARVIYAIPYRLDAGVKLMQSQQIAVVQVDTSKLLMREYLALTV